MNITNEDVKAYNELAGSTREARARFTNALLTLYGAVVSGLFIFISTSSAIARLTSVQKNMLAGILLSAVAIVLLCLAEKVCTYFGNDQMGKKFVEEVKTNNRIRSVKPNKLTGTILKTIPVALILLITANAVAVCIYSLDILL